MENTSFRTTLQRLHTEQPKNTRKTEKKIPGWQALLSRDKLSLLCLICGLAAITLLTTGVEAGILIGIICSIAGLILGVRAIKADGWNLSNKFGLLMSVAGIAVLAIALLIAGDVYAHVAAALNGR